MKIRMRNEIKLGEEAEIIDQIFEVDLVDKGDYRYLLFYNEEREKVVLKFSEKELVMTRFSSPKSLMRFVKDEEALVLLPTPLGNQHFVTETSLFEVSEQKLRLHYALKPLEGEKIFATYQMEIAWS